MNKTYQAYYTHSTHIVNFMVDLLDCKSMDRVLEPAAGDGVFVDEIINRTEPEEIVLCELNPASVDGLHEKYQFNTKITVRETNALIDTTLSLECSFGKGYDKIIANPPYGAWQEPELRSHLKKKYPDMYVKETYSLFLARCIDLLNTGGDLVFIIPDTFLNLHRHTSLRQKILTECTIKHIIRFDSKFFPGVNFGYAKLVILHLRKHPHTEQSDYEFPITTGLKNPNDLKTNLPCHAIQKICSRKQMWSSLDHALYLSDDNRTLELLNNASQRIGDIADCVTGIYTGNDKKFLRMSANCKRKSSDYKSICIESIRVEPLNDREKMHGIMQGPHFVPIVKGSGGYRFFRPSEWYIDWSVDAVQNYKSCKKGRFQNAQFYFRNGLALPMVSSKRISASKLSGRIFDQSIVGVFPRKDEWSDVLLLLFNSDLGNRLIRTINPSANNSANYVRKIPAPSTLTRSDIEIARVLAKRLSAISERETLNPSHFQDVDDFINALYR